jgi:putative membrane protein
VEVWPGEVRARDKEVADMMFGYGSHWAFWQVALMWLGMIGFWALVIGAVYAIVTQSNRGGSGTPQSPGTDPRRILDERLARGDIDVDEHRRLRDAISSGDGQPAVGSAK